MQPLDLVALAAHPDDVELACAGTMLMMKRAGKRTGIVDFTQGELSTRGTLESRARETAAASKILQLDYRANLKMPDGNIELSQENLRRVIIQLRKTRPTILLAPSRHERHPDHEAAAELAHRAAFYAGLVKMETTDEDGTKQEPHRPLLVLYYMQSYSFEPKIILDVSPVFEERMKAMEAYHSQFFSQLFSQLEDGVEGRGQRVEASSAAPQNTLPSTLYPLPSAPKERMTILAMPGFMDGLRARASHYGMMIGVRYAEPFWSQTILGTQDLFSLVTKTIA